MAPSLAVLVTLLAPIVASWRTTDVETITQCTTQYGPAGNVSESSSTWISTDTYTTTTYANFYKTEVLTPKPLTTTLSVTSTFTTYETQGGNLTTTIFTSTYFDTTTVVQFETVPTTTTITVSEAETLTVPTLTGFTPVASVFPGAALKTSDWQASDQWDVEDVYWTSEPSYDNRGGLYSTGLIFDRLMPLYAAPLPTDILHRRDEQPSQPSRVACTLTIQSNYFMSTVSIKQTIPTSTYTRTTYVATETSTSTVQTKPTGPVASTVETVQYDYYSTSTSYTTQTTTTIETATTTVYPSTTSAYAACATNNIIDSYNNFPLNALAATNYTVKQYNSYSWADDADSVYTAEDCCSRAAANPKAIFWRFAPGYGSGCEIYLGSQCPNADGINGTEGGIRESVDVFYEPIADRGWWSSFTIGNGACGGVNFVSLWE
ncbi:hypothetical protein N0V94_006746 [Neodidymelliopsis sp. IMI 364377]|nr:hypothetical protein N0V94_006746 [Neodidymelliopsis sp. IMI 364377]